MNESLVLRGRVRMGRRLDTPAGKLHNELATGRIPRVARLMALAIHFEEQLRSGKVRNYAQIAKLGQVTRARVTQIMNLRALAPDIQEALLHLSRVERGRDPICLAQLQPIARTILWSQQRIHWRRLLEISTAA